MTSRYKDKEDRIEFCITSVLITHEEDGAIHRRHIDRVYVSNLQDWEELEDMEKYLLDKMHLRFTSL